MNVSLCEQLIVSTNDQTLSLLDVGVLKNIASTLGVSFKDENNNVRNLMQMSNLEIIKGLREKYPLGDDVLDKSVDEIMYLLNNPFIAEHGVELLDNGVIVIDTDSSSSLKGIEQNGEQMLVGIDDDDQEDVEDDLYVLETCSDMKKRVRVLLNLRNDQPEIQPEMKKKKVVKKETSKRMVEIMRQVPDLLSHGMSIANEINDLSKKIDDISKRTNECGQRIDVQAKKIGDISKRIDDHANKTNELAEKIDALSKDIYGLTIRQEEW